MNKLNRIFGLVGAGLVVIVMAAVPISSLYAAEFVAPGEDGNVIISSSESKRNLYTAGADVLVNSATAGDLVVVGGSITVEGDVEGDVLVAGGTVYINGAVGGDVRAAGGEVTIGGTVAGDVVAAGGTVMILEGSTIGGDLTVASGDLRVLAPVAGQLTVYSGSVYLNSAIVGAVMIEAGDKLTLGEKTVFGADAKYKSPQEAQVADGAQIGSLQYEKIDRQPSKDKSGGVGKVLSFGFILKLLAMILTALVLSKLFPKTAQTMVNHLVANPWSNLGIGFVAFIAVPITALVLVFTLVGWYAAVILFMLWIAWAMVAALVGVVTVGTWIYQKLMKRTDFTLDWQSIAIGVAVMGLVGLVPVIGWLASLLVFLAGFGTIIRYIGGVINSQQPPKAVVATPAPEEIN